MRGGRISWRIASGCRKVLRDLDSILQEYNRLSDKERSKRRLWQKIRFGNGMIADIKELREKIVYHTQVLSLYLNLVSTGTIGRVEAQMEEAGGDLKEVKREVNSLTAHLLARATSEGSILTAYTNDDKAVWKDFRRDLVRRGYSSSFLHKNRRTIQAYFEELGSRGVLDDSFQPSTSEEANIRKSTRAMSPDENSVQLSEEVAGIFLDEIPSKIAVKEQKPGQHKDTIAPSAPTLRTGTVVEPPRPSLRTDYESDSDGALKRDYKCTNEHNVKSTPHQPIRHSTRRNSRYIRTWNHDYNSADDESQTHSSANHIPSLPRVAAIPKNSPIKKTPTLPRAETMPGHSPKLNDASSDSSLEANSRRLSAMYLSSNPNDKETQQNDGSERKFIVSEWGLCLKDGCDRMETLLANIVSVEHTLRPQYMTLDFVHSQLQEIQEMSANMCILKNDISRFTPAPNIDQRNICELLECGYELWDRWGCLFIDCGSRFWMGKSIPEASKLTEKIRIVYEEIMYWNEAFYEHC